MKNKTITIIIAEDYYFGIPTLNNLVNKYENEIKSVVIIKDFFSLKKIFYIIFMFNPIFIFKKILFSFKEKKKFEKIIKKKINLNFTHNVNSIQTIDFLKKQKNEVLIILSCPQILKEKTLRIHKKNLNFHCSDLPRNRGLFPLFFTYIDYQGKMLFCNLHKITKKIDDGEIIIHKSLKLKSVSLGNMYQSAFSQFELIFGNLIKNKYKKKRNINKLKTYNSYPKIKDFIKYYKILLFNLFFFSRD